MVKSKTNYLKLKYNKIMQVYKNCDDDRRLAYNIYNQILEVLEELKECDNSYILVAISKEIKKDCRTIDNIIARFTNN